VNSNNKNITDIAIQEEILSGIESTLLKNPKQFEFVPSNSGLTNLTLNNLLQTFNQLLLDREKVRTNLGANNPNNLMLDEQLTNLRGNIIENISSIKRDIQTSKNALRSRELSLNQRLSSLPHKERQLIDIQRQQNVKQNLYLYLMQKREETALKLSIAVGNSRVVEPAKLGVKFKPKPVVIWNLALLSGILLPILLIGIIKFFSNAIKNEEDIKSNTSVPIIGTLGWDKSKNSIILNDKTRSPISEMFRLMRANLQFIGEGINNKVIVLTSSASGEGKSFVCINLGLTLALTGKKVLLLELDMRKPKFFNYLNLKGSNTQGITEYLVKDSVEWQSIITETGIHPKLFCSTCGPIPPNPSELILSSRFCDLINNLRNEFDYILIDTPPVGMVSDSLSLNNFADSTLYIVRYNKTLKSQLNIIENISAEKKMPRPYIVFNGVKFNKRGYRYGYGYGYGYGYYEES
ncbi:MAG: polysaccharide biosynthesis tyrosine autokinase, partial [Ferruginibacter sp.]|nr:polysaccharide biosynthesis tyrosine autokinase [Ferruginibacter sp.]